jgi:NADH:ubiquinone reductase (H+-translocating)
LAPSNAAFSLRSILQHDSNVDVKMAEVVSADLNTRTIKTSDGKMYQGDFLILAAGSQVNFFGTQGASQYAFPLYSLQDAESLRSHILALLESTARDPSLIDKRALTFVIVGAGPTGTETAGTLGEIPHALNEIYKNVNLGRVEVHLVDLVHNVLNAFLRNPNRMSQRCWRNMA